MQTFRLTSIIWKEKEGYVSKCPELGVASAGDTVEEALYNLKIAILNRKEQKIWVSHNETIRIKKCKKEHTF